MRKIMSTFVIIVLAMILVMSLVGCNGGTKTLAKVPELSSDVDRDKVKLATINSCINDFSARLTSSVYKESDKKSNLAMSPLAVYMSLAMLGECVGDDERAGIDKLLGTSYNTVYSSYKALFDDVVFDYKDDIGRERSHLAITNSIWLDKNVDFNKDTVTRLANNYYCNSFATKFKDDNKGANRAIQKFVKKNTKGLIDGNFNLSEETIFALVSTLYLKDIWNEYGDDLPFGKDKYTFINRDGSTKETQLLESEYSTGNVQKLDNAMMFKVATRANMSIKFILPNRNVSIDEVMNSANIKNANSIKDYGAVDDVAKKKYFTRCYFPEFSGAIDSDLAGIIEREFGFKMPNTLKNLTTTPLDGGGSILHRATLKVDKHGIEGASAVVLPGATSPGPDEYEKVYQDFVVDRAFGFIVSDFQGHPIFTGVVNHI